MSTGPGLGALDLAEGPQTTGPVGLQTLLDLLVGVYQEFYSSPFSREKYVSGFLQWVEPLVKQVKKTRIKREDFHILKVIGRGTFSEVAVARMRKTQQVYALKIMNKWDLLQRGESACYQEEREVLLKGDRRWITELHYAFQDDNYLYLVMDYYVGGDLLTLLSKFGDRIHEDMAQFYLAEMVMAIDSVHRLGYVHRDIKPDNIMLTCDGHIRLGDFGSCLRLQEDGMEYFEFPPSGPEISEKARSFITGLICERDVRLGRKGSSDFRSHLFFSGLDWSSLHKLPAPYRPEVSNPTDTSNFDILDDCLSDMERLSDVMDRAPIGVHLAFVGYSYTATSQTGAIDRSQDIMMQIDDKRLRECETLYSPEEMSQLWQLADVVVDNLPPLLDLPLTQEKGPTASTHTTTTEEEEEVDRISGLDEDYQSRHLHEAERRYCELEKEMERLKEEMQNWQVPKEIELSISPAFLALPAHCVDSTWDRERAPPVCHYPLVIPLHRHLLLFHRVRLPQVMSESYLLVCAEGGQLQAWERHCYSELS
ncbi:myotonin-protein kinase isoform X5 [Parambassis ranga]|uniref:non-specific serine/threonine protein kinase n=1 Tax=Parambassis ranga TaxID=210632 RepID=A0A6P7JKP6_9TELE|nr:myotonin-protein kinase isoform X5 [Parambassis ranga]